MRLEQSRHKKRVPSKFHRPGFAMLRARHHLQADRCQLWLVFRVDFVIAEELLHYFIAAVNPVQKRDFLQAYAGNRTTQLGVRGTALRHGTGYRRNDDVLGLGIMLGAVGVGEFQDIAGTL